MDKSFIDGDHLKELVEAATAIERQFGFEKALGYLIGEKFYHLVSAVHESRRIIRSIDDARKKPWYNPLRERVCGNSTYSENMDMIYEKEIKTIVETEAVLVGFADLIKAAFAPHKIRLYFESNPRLGTLGHVISDEQYDTLVSKGSVEHTLDTEIEDALILGDILKFF